MRYYTNYLPLKKKKIKWGLYVSTHNILWRLYWRVPYKWPAWSDSRTFLISFFLLLDTPKIGRNNFSISTLDLSECLALALLHLFVSLKLHFCLHFFRNFLPQLFSRDLFRNRGARECLHQILDPSSFHISHIQGLFFPRGKTNHSSAISFCNAKKAITIEFPRSFSLSHKKNWPHRAYKHTQSGHRAKRTEKCPNFPPNPQGWQMLSEYDLSWR